MKRLGLMAVLVLAATWAAGLGLRTEPWLRASARPDRTAVPQGETFRVAVTLDLDAGYHIYASSVPAQEGLTAAAVVPAPATGIRWGRVHYPAGKPFSLPGLPTYPIYDGRTTIVVDAAVEDDAPPGETALGFALSYQGCSEDACYPAATVTATAAVRIVARGTEAAPAEPLQIEAEPLRAEGQTDLEALFHRSAVLYFLALFAGGLLLNLTPCVFPLVPVTMSIFAQQSERRTARILLLAALYVLGLAGAFAAVGVIAALTGQSLGFILQRPVGVLAVMAVLALMMASLFGAFEIQLPSGLAGRLGARRGLLGAMFMGIVMGAVAAPCVGPFLIALITFIAQTAAAPGTSTAYAVFFGAVSFFATGVGLGAPFLLLGLFTGLISRYPRSGGWMVWVKKSMGFALAGLILYYMQPYVQAEFFWLLALATAVLAAAYLGVLEGGSRRPFKRGFQIVRLATAAAVLGGGVGLYAWATAPHVEIEWTPWSPGALERARAEGKPALLYFGASWCVECRQWHAGIFADPEAIAESRNFARISVDVSQPPEGAQRELAERFNGIYPPVVVLFAADGSVRKVLRTPPEAKAFVAWLKEASP
jgi:thioredoxin:protein disulfide reductase